MNHLESEHAKGAKLRVYIILELEGEKLISMYLKDNMNNQTSSELYTDDKKTENFSNPNNILKSTKDFYEKLYTKRQPIEWPLANRKNFK